MVPDRLQYAGCQRVILSQLLVKSEFCIHIFQDCSVTCQKISRMEFSVHTWDGEKPE